MGFVFNLNIRMYTCIHIDIWIVWIQYLLLSDYFSLKFVSLQIVILYLIQICNYTLNLNYYFMENNNNFIVETFFIKISYRRPVYTLHPILLAV